MYVVCIILTVFGEAMAHTASCSCCCALVAMVDRNWQPDDCHRWKLDRRAVAEWRWFARGPRKRTQCLVVRCHWAGHGRRLVVDAARRWECRWATLAERQPVRTRSVAVAPDMAMVVHFACAQSAWWEIDGMALRMCDALRALSNWNIWRVISV